MHARQYSLNGWGNALGSITKAILDTYLGGRLDGSYPLSSKRPTCIVALGKEYNVIWKLHNKHVATRKPVINRNRTGENGEEIQDTKNKE